MGEFEEELKARLDLLERANLRRTLRSIAPAQQTRAMVNGRDALNFSSNDYLGFATHPKLKEAGMAALREHGAGSGASRLISGSLQVHHACEERIALFKGTESALVFSTGHATALGVIPALAGRDDIVVIDRLAHASIVDGARLSGAKLRVFRHNDTADLERILRWCDQQRPSRKARVLIITESLFSMDGDIAPLREIVALKECYGAWLMVDEAHATGVYGAQGRGLLEALGVSRAVEIQMGTLGKAVGAAGGFIAGARVLTEYLVNKARSFIFSTAPAPAVSAMAAAGIELIGSEEGARARSALRENISLFSAELGLKPAAENSPIFPLVLGDEQEALRVAAALWEANIFVPAIRYPTVARGQARLRITFSAAHSSAEVRRLASALRACGQG